MADPTPYDEYHDAHLDELESTLEPEGRGLHPAILLAILAAVGLVVFMLVDGMKSETYFYEVHQAVAQGPDLVGQTVRVKGTVEEGSIVGEDGKLGRTFRISHKGKTLEVSYDRALPDTFKKGVEVVAQGEVNDGYVLEADEVLVKCPSRYEGKAPTAHTGEEGSYAPSEEKIVR